MTSSRIALLAVLALTLVACGGVDIPPTTEGRDGGVEEGTGVVTGSAVQCPSWDPYCEVGPGGGDGGDTGGSIDSVVTVTVTNADAVPRTFNGSTYLRTGPNTEDIYARNHFLPAVDLAGGASMATTVTVPFGQTLAIGVSGYWVQTPSAWARYERQSKPAGGTYSCRLTYSTASGVGVMAASGCP